MCWHPRPRVLVVDDAPEVARRIVQQVEELELFEVAPPIDDLAQALHAWETSRPDAVVLDLQLGAASGLTMLATIRASARPCVVVVLTASNEPSLREACLAGGADRVLVKALDCDRVGEVLRDLLGAAAG
ncbi:MAG: response regulator [Deltaproteobacteria bacterium]|nr:response regulator [Deltaproteobacteria bacterium]